MTPAQHDPQNDLSRTLSRQAERFTERGGAPIELENVLARAGEIRRGRRMRATMVMAAVVLAIAVPVGIQVVGENDPSGRKPPPVAAEPTDSTPLALDGLKTGDAPKNGYVLNGTLLGGGGAAPQPLDGQNPVSDLARLSNGYLLARQDTETGSSTIYFQGNGNSASGSDWTYNGNGIVVSAERNVGVFVETDGTVMAVESGGDRSFELGTLPDAETENYTPIAVNGDNCAPTTSDEHACEVYVRSDGALPATWVVRANDATPEKVADLAGLRGISNHGDRSFQTSYNDDGTSCWKVTDLDDAERWDTCTYALKSFSPDGKYLIGEPSDTDGIGAGSLTLLDATTGEPVLDLRTTRETFVYDAVWEDDTHVLATLVQGDSWAVVRVGLKGSREYAVPTVPGGGDFAAPFQLG